MAGTKETLGRLMRESGQALFEAYGLAVTLEEQPHRVEGVEVQVAGIIGFTGDELRGSVMLAMSPEALRASLQAPSERPQDWMGELTNQLLGRLKNRLAAFNVDITITTPLVIRGERIAPIMDGDAAPLVWHLTKGKAYGWLDVETQPGLELKEAAGAVEVVAEGDSLFF